ncbi:MAG: hypothetical protein J0M34_03870 [Alphaproteobacteria bacterium]|nr:hypothetical protein [Alphaproteobacteria bacterium]
MFLPLEMRQASLDEKYPSTGILWRVDSESNPPERAGSIDLSRPCVVYFGGGAYLSMETEQLATQYRTLQHIIDGAVPSSAFDFYSFTLESPESGSVRSNKTACNKYASAVTDAYNEDPKQFFSLKAQQFVDQALASYFPDGRSMNATERAEAMNVLARQLSNLTIFANSYGTTFTQEVRNVLVHMLDERGFEEKEMNPAILAVAAIGVGPNATIKPKYPDFSQVTLLYNEDKSAMAESGIHIGHPHLDFRHTEQPIARADVGAVDAGAHHILLSRETDTTLRGVGFRNQELPKLPLQELAAAAHDIEGQVADRTQETPHMVHRQVDPHNKPLYTSALHHEMRDDGIYYVIPSNVLGINTCRFITEMVKASAQGDRDTGPALNAAVDRFITPEQMQKDQSQVDFFVRLHQSLGQDNPKSAER